MAHVQEEKKQLEEQLRIKTEEADSELIKITSKLENSQRKLTGELERQKKIAQQASERTRVVEKELVTVQSKLSDEQQTRVQGVKEERQKAACKCCPSISCIFPTRRLMMKQCSSVVFYSFSSIVSIMLISKRNCLSKPCFLVYSVNDTYIVSLFGHASTAQFWSIHWMKLAKASRHITICRCFALYQRTLQKISALK